MVSADKLATPLPASEYDTRLLLLSERDNVLVAREEIAAGDEVLVMGRRLPLEKAIHRGHKIARKPVASGEKVMKYGAPIGSATMPIDAGQHVHIHNMKSDYTATHIIDASEEEKSR
ncbi:MAG: UxaA family hydrolase [Phyllobacterium sp.]